MLTTADFLTYTKWTGLVTLGFAILAGLGFILQWGIRFRLVGITGFMVVLTGGLFALSVVPFTHATVPGARQFTIVYDNGASQAVISVPVDITETELSATLQQAANDLFSYGRLGDDTSRLTVRARAVLHPRPGVSQPVWLGQVERSLAVRADSQIKVKIERANWHLLPKA
jgi:hypothetical protein